MLGSALVRSLANEQCEILVASRSELDLRNQAAVDSWMRTHQPSLIFHVGARVGGIYANATEPADFLYSNIMIQSNVINAAYRIGVEKLVFVASNCIYPKDAPQPISETSILCGSLEENIRFYGTAKIAGIEMCRAYRLQYGCNFVSIIPPNLYGPGDNYHPEWSHVVAGILRRTHEAKVEGRKEMVVWGDGSPRREILHVDDLAAAMKCVMTSDTTHDVYNVGSGYDFTIAELAQLVAETVDFNGSITYDRTKPNGTPRKLLDSSRVRGLGWAPRINERDGLRSAYADFLDRHAARLEVKHA